MRTTFTLGILLTLASGLASAQPPPPQWPQDFTYLGSTQIPSAPGPLTVNGDSPYGKGLAVRVEAGTVTLYTVSWNPQVVLRWTAPRDATGHFSGPAVFKANLGRIPYYSEIYGLYWDIPTQSLWSSSESSYDGDPAINDTLGRATTDPVTGTLVPGGRFSFAARSDKFTNGGVTAIPDWLQTILGCGRVAVFGGGYESMIAVGPASMGPALTCFSLPDASITSGALPNKPLLAYPFSSSTTVHTPAAERDTDYTQTFGWGWWPPSVTSAPGWWAPGDSLWQGCAYVDTPAVSGLVCAPMIQNGCIWYGDNAIPQKLPVCSSTPGKAAALNSQRASHWIYTYDWRDLAAVAKDEKAQNAIQPWQRAELRLPGVTYPLGGWPNIIRMVTGVYYEPTQHLFAIMIRNAVTGGHPTIFWYEVKSTRAFTFTGKRTTTVTTTEQTTVTVSAASEAEALALAQTQAAQWTVAGTSSTSSPASWTPQ